MKYKKGQEVYFVGISYNQYKKILTCGSKFMTLEGVKGKVDIENGIARSSTGSFLGRIYFSLEEYSNHLKVRKLIMHLKYEIGSMLLTNVTEEQVKQAYALFGLPFPDIA